ncbi:NOE3-like protein [Mya arenaria]|uniref:NOE3-like protein n=2 Tax=Mya arenaria TaxID=6604 RepID=A0ABY7DXY3_MYAAR|nr:myocilin-like isoform X1 [Mya arenaria]WAR02615.1 NOE3-like protein [Mya arenaria]
MGLSLVTFLLLLLLSSNAQVNVNAPEKCVFQYDMSNRVKITCGHGAVLHIVDQHGNTLLTGETTSPADTPVIFQLNRSSISSLNDEAARATKKLNEASKLLRKVREDLSLQITNLINLTSLLQRGDEELKNDFNTIRRHEINSQLVREAIIAALQNQYNFLRMGLLSQNTHLNELIRTTSRLTTAIMNTARGARGIGDVLDLRADVMNQTLYNITKLMPGGFEHGAFFGEKTVFCPQQLRKISDKGMSVVCGVDEGQIMVDPYTPEKIWVMYSFTNINEISQYTSIRSLKFELVDKTISLPFSCVGTGHVVFKHALYCQKMFTNKIVKYSLAEARFLGERQLEHVGVHDTFPYQSGKNSDIDFAIDETGLWVIYATNSSNGCIVISKLNEDLSFEDTWVTEITKKHVGNAFIICGILYATNAYDEVPTFIKYTFDTRTARGKVLEPGVLPFRNSVSGDYAKVYALDYNPSDKALYSWNNGRVEIFPVSFVDDSDP